MNANRIFPYTVLGLSVMVSMFLLLAYTFSWTLLWAFMELFTANLNFHIYMVYGVIVLLSLVSLVISRKSGLLTRILPVGINTITILLLVFLPFRKMGLEMDIRRNFEKRLKVVQLIENGKLHVDNRGRVKLPFHLTHLSKDGGLVSVRQDEDVMRVLFYTYRGVIDNFSGILYSSADTEPPDFMFGADVSVIRKLRDNWYWVVFT